MRRAWLFVVAAAILVATGVAHGLRTERWVPATEITEGARRLENVPLQSGEWAGKPVEIDARQLRIAQVAGHFACRYTHKPTGRDVTVLIVSGRPGAIGAHSPDVCYTGAGFRLSPDQTTAPLKGLSRPAQFSHAFASKGEPQPSHLSIWWAWSADGASWEVPTSPRARFWRSPNLYKIYFIRQVGSSTTPDDLTRSLMEELIPRFAQALSPP
jgi:hypothetical protein